VVKCLKKLIIYNETKLGSVMTQEGKAIMESEIRARRALYT